MSSYAEEMAYIQRECAEAEEADFAARAVEAPCACCGWDTLVLPGEGPALCAQCDYEGRKPTMQQVIRWTLEMAARFGWAA